jgi:UDP-glucose 4-epimerase
MTPRRVLVTGGAGFIGSHIVDDLLEAGCEVVVLDNFSSGVRDNLPRSSALRLIEGDVRDAAAVERAAEGVDAISHQAAQLEITACLKDPGLDLAVNTGATLNVLAAAQRHGVRRVVYASSACVYGQAQTELQSEDHPTVPNWPYGISKLAAEHYARLTAETAGLHVTGLRYAIVYGPREWYGRALTAFVRRALGGEPPVLWGQGHAVRDFVYVGDVVRVHRAALWAQGGDGTHAVYNVSTGVGTSMAQLAALVCELTGLTAGPLHEAISEGELSQHVANRRRLPSELKRMVLDNRRATAALGVAPRVRLRDGLQEEIAWARQNLGRWETLRY